MNRKEKIELCLKKRKEIEEKNKELREQINANMQEYELLGDLATKLLDEEEKERKVK